jgi:hypothetical protein
VTGALAARGSAVVVVSRELTICANGLPTLLKSATVAVPANVPFVSTPLSFPDPLTKRLPENA